MKKININEGIRFECQGSSNCCVSRGSYGFVYLSNLDIKKLSQYFNLKKNKFIKLYCDRKDGFIHLKEKSKNGDCQYLVKKRCSVYNARPTQCRTWPFWEENMNAKTWNQDISSFCPGIGKGKNISKEKINEYIKKDKLNEERMLKEIKI
tara:strand:+ start:70 stop:519 length:450 start_codon:yes stop_codon:yes gene_type:complete